MKGRGAIAVGFLALIVSGAFLLSLPWARTEGAFGAFWDALFMACSAVCVTGLSVVDIAATYTRAGQIVLLVLVEFGCLGLMTCGTFLLVAIGRRLSLAREFSLADAYGAAGIRGVRGLICWVVGSMLVLEGLGAAVLYWRLGHPYESVFYAVMGFCNAGFSLRGDSLASFAGDPLVILTLACETILGGLGFLALYNLCTYRFRRRAGAHGRLSLHTRVVLRMTFLLLALAFLAFLLLEWRGALAGQPLGRKLLVASYQAVTPRTCGFTLVPVASLRPLTRHLYALLMFIGGAPGSAAAGLKVTTLAVLVATLLAMCRGETDTVLRDRVVPPAVVRESIVIFMALVAFVFVISGALLATESGRGLSSDALFFEALSAITTTGLSMGDTTARLSAGGRVAIMVAMFLGRLGALTVVLMIGDRESNRHVRHPTEELVVG